MWLTTEVAHRPGPISPSQEVMTVQQDDEADEMVNAPIVSHDLRAALESMVAAMRTKETAKRVAFKIPFVLGKDLSIGITGCV